MRDPAAAQIDPPPCVGLHDTIAIDMQSGRPGMGIRVIEPYTGMWTSSAPVELNDGTATTQAPAESTSTPSGITSSGVLGSGVVLPGGIRAMSPPVGPCCWAIYVPAVPAATTVRWLPSSRVDSILAVKGAAASAAGPELRPRMATA